MFARAAFIKVKPGCEAGLTGDFEQEVVWARVVLEILLVQV